KIALFCNVDRGAVIEEQDVASSIYEVPIDLLGQGIDTLISGRLGLPSSPPDLADWQQMLDSVRNPLSSVEIAVVGKYMRLRDAYKSVFEALDHAGAHHRVKVVPRCVESEDIEKQGPGALLDGVSGVLVPGGFGNRGIEGKILAVRHARENSLPFLGLCLGMQCATIEFARNVAGLAGANSTEFDATSPHPVISLLPGQENIERKGATMRLGACDCVLQEGTAAHRAYGSSPVSERHRHRYEFNNDYRRILGDKGLVFCGTSPDGMLVEMIEIPSHPWFVATQAHPEFKSRPASPHPLFRDFVGAAAEPGPPVGRTQ
ncbi:MAG: CTP synthase, partial [Planctomycetes bacterium]|nr:CTP synthase [Planctomycetota bacterium]